MLYILVLTQLLAHIIADFYGQTDQFCEKKEKEVFRSWRLYAHGGVVFLCSWIFSATLDFWWMALVLGISHITLDALKSGYKDTPYAFWIDQVFHIYIILTACYTFFALEAYTPVLLINTQYLLITIGLLLCIKPANIVIREIFRHAQIQPISQNKNGELPNAGKLIGSFERLLAFFFVLLGQYEALGFLIAAKSLLRLRDSETAKSEYVLVGTLISFFIAILLGVLVNKLASLI